LRVAAALRAAARRPAAPFVATAFRAAACRAALPRRRAAWCAWRASAPREAARDGSRFSARTVARERVRDGRRPRRAARDADAVLFRVAALARPLGGVGSFTPARRALLSPMAIACFVDRAPCLPSRM
jgi:hypothetical protein